MPERSSFFLSCQINSHAQTSSSRRSLSCQSQDSRKRYQDIAVQCRDKVSVSRQNLQRKIPRIKTLQDGVMTKVFKREFLENKQFEKGFSGFSILLDTLFLSQQEATTSSDTSGSFSCHEQERIVSGWFSRELTANWP